ncbi:MAG: histidinol-phosphatase HisJ family protein [Anaerolineae bacterium]|nr:histidinol-phosphatase HisJ family protein [Anaerolineae bacterium]
MTTPNGRIPQDMHTHNRISCDSQATMEEMCQSALERGITEIAFTDHFDCHPDDYCHHFYRPAAYFEQLAAARHVFEPQGLTIRAGVELGEFHRFHDVQQPVLDQYPYDVILGSLHWVGDRSVFDDDFFKNAPPQDTIGAYFRELAELAQYGGFDVLSHPDVIKRVAYRVYGEFDITAWEDLVRPVWQACIDNQIAIEINTTGLRLPVQQAHPAPDALRWYREMGGERLTVGSDAHRPDHIAYEFETARTMARAAGFTRLCRFERRKMVEWMDI